MNQSWTRRISHLVVAAILGVAAFILVLTATDPPGPGLDPDAMAYLGAAESVAGHAQYRVPAADWRSADSTSALTHFPPGFPTALALPVRLGMAPPQAARLANALAAAVTVAVLVLLVAATVTLPAAALLGMALMVTPAMAVVHLSVLSEPLFLACTALTLAAMARPRTHPLVLGVPAALGALTRYAGVALVGAAVLWAAAERAPLRERVRRAGMALVPGALLQGLWVLRTQALHEPATIRKFALYGALGPTLRQGGATLRDWLVPDPNAWSDPVPHRGLLALGAALLLALVVAGGVRRTERGGARAAAPLRLLAACALLGGCYLGILVVSRLLADPGIPFDERILAPFLLLATVGLVAAGGAWWRGTARRTPRIALATAVAAWGVTSAWATHDQVRYALDWGSDFAGEQWRRSALLAWARDAGVTHRLYSTWPAAVYFHLHRPSRDVPAAAAPGSLAAFADTVRAHDGRVLVFSIAAAGFPTLQQLRAAPGLRVVAELEDGAVMAGK